MSFFSFFFPTGFTGPPLACISYFYLKDQKRNNEKGGSKSFSRVCNSRERPFVHYGEMDNGWMDTRMDRGSWEGASLFVGHRQVHSDNLLYIDLSG